jgi:uncharacterized protein (DUF433 family)
MARKRPFDIGKLITCTPGIYGGRPCLAGTRFPILQVAAEFDAGMTAAELIENYGLDPAAAYAGIAYYLANKAAVDGELAENLREGLRMAEEQRRERARASS